ncbi:response regulator transcription factor [Photobacterium kishitanii]|uniref:response regulator transcription factor n=1 Tax=Photobacterium kishitanii TaxID=318456 RepID=UPI000D158231|nr:DNA-binding response regulator [Photobacterium kishitanii]
MSNILIIEDDQQLREMLCYFLSSIEGYNVSCISSGENAVEYIFDKKPDLVLLDIQLPKVSGLSILKSLRDQGYIHPVIIMTANDSEITETNALSLGADDYITKPIRTNALRERIKRQIRPVLNDKLNVVNDNFYLDTHISCLCYKHNKVSLAPAEVEILEILIKENRPVPVFELFEMIHGFSYQLEDRSVYMRIFSIRKKIAAIFPDIDLVKNRRNKGFYLNYCVIKI